MLNVPALHDALSITRDQISLLKVAEAALLNILGGEPRTAIKSQSQIIAEAVLKALLGEPVPKSAPQISGSGDLPKAPEPALSPEPRRRAVGYRKPNPYRSRIANMINFEGPKMIAEILDRFPDLSKQTAYNIVCSSGWFEKVPNDDPRSINRYQLSEKGREEYAKAKAQAPEAS